MTQLDTNWFDYTILIIYFALVITIGILARRAIATSEDFLLSGRSLTAWITGLAFISANLGAIEILGMAANGAQYGLSTVHFYWIGAVPAMVFLGLVMMPFYYGSRVRSVPEYLLRRFNPATHLWNALTFAVASVLSAGVNLFAMALIIEVLLGWPTWVSVIVSAGFVLIYIFLGGLSGAIYNEVLQFFVIIAGLIPIVIIGLKAIGGWSGLMQKVTSQPGHENHFETWGGTAVGNWTNPLGDWIGIVMGLGFVLSFGYWTTNFAEVQRALSAKNLSAAERTPLIGAFPKIFIPFLTIVPGLIAVALIPNIGQTEDLNYNYAIPISDERVPSERDARYRAGRPAGGVHGRHGGQRELLQHRVHLRHLAGLRTQAPARWLLPERRPGRHRRRCLDRHRDSVHSGWVQQHHGLHPDAVLVLQCAGVRDLHHRDVLEAHYPVGRLLRTRRGVPRGPNIPVPHRAEYRVLLSGW